MAKIIINRKNEFMHRLRKFDVYIDDQKVGAVSKGGSEEFNVSAGRHNVHCKLSWYSSNRYDVDVSDKDVKFLEVRSNAAFFPVLYVLLLAVLILPIAFRHASWLTPELLERSRWIVLGIVILYGLYYSLFARNKYLWLGEDKSSIFNN